MIVPAVVTTNVVNDAASEVTKAVEQAGSEVSKIGSEAAKTVGNLFWGYDK